MSTADILSNQQLTIVLNISWLDYPDRLQGLLAAVPISLLTCAELH